MLKSDVWIRLAVRNGIIENGCEQLIKYDGCSYGVSSYGYDVQLSALKKYWPLKNGVMDPKAQDEERWDNVKFNPKLDCWEIPPYAFALGCTVETFHLPRNIAGLVFLKSTYARCGLLCYQTVLEAGWEGQITLEFYNPLPVPIRLYDSGVAQVLFFEGECGITSYADRKGKYQGQSGITLARVD